MNTASSIVAMTLANRDTEDDVFCTEGEELFLREVCGETCSHCDERYTLWDAINLVFGLILFAAFVYTVSNIASC